MAPNPYPYPPQGPHNPYGQGPVPYPTPPPGVIYGAPVQSDGKATVSLILGILSITCCLGLLTGVPAIIIGVMSRRDIAKSGGALGGDGMAMGGLVTGIIGTLGSIAYVAFNVILFGAAASSAATYTPPPPYTPYTAYTAPTYAPATGSVSVIDLHRTTGDLKSQLLREISFAKAKGHKTLVMTIVKPCTACDDIAFEITDPDMQRVLRSVTLLRVDTDEFRVDLAGLKMDREGAPWFFTFDDTATTQTGAISADEWDDNTGANMAPVLEKFMLGAYVPHTAGSASTAPTVKPVPTTKPSAKPVPTGKPGSTVL